ncbi:hypothetical protein ABW365_16060 [Enterococcus avium]
MGVYLLEFMVVLLAVEQRKLWNIYMYLFYSCYFLLLFIMLFTKARAYHSFNLNPFELYLNNGQQITELILNTGYFIR